MSLAPVTYTSTFFSKNLETTKFIQVLEDHQEKHEVSMYTGREGLEAVVHCNNRFKRVATKLHWTPQQKFDNYENILNDEALQYWTDTVLEVAWTDPATQEGFNEALQMMITHFSGCDKARDFIIEYVQGKNCRKNKNTSVNDHVNRIKYLLHIANLCEGEEDYITESHKKRILFKTFPKVWQNNFTNSGKVVTDLNYNEIQQYFNQQKRLSDTIASLYNENGRPKRRNQYNFNNQGRNNKRQFRGNQRSNNNNQQNQQGFNPAICRHPEHKHLNKKHLWKDCIYNPRSQKYRGHPYQPNQNQGSQNNKGGNPQNNSRGRGNYRNNSNNSYNHQNPSNSNRNENHEMEETINETGNSHNELHAFNLIGKYAEEPNEDSRNKTVANVSWKLGTGDRNFIE